MFMYNFQLSLLMLFIILTIVFVYIFITVIIILLILDDDIVELNIFIILLRLIDYANDECSDLDESEGHDDDGEVADVGPLVVFLDEVQLLDVHDDEQRQSNVPSQT